MRKKDWGFARAIRVLAACAVLSGCQSSLDRPAFDPELSATMALEQCDKNADGQIDQGEAGAVPGMQLAFIEWDSDRDKVISTQEIVDRIAKYRDGAGAIAAGSFTVTYRRKPLEGAEVTFEPEPLMGEGFEVVTGTTDQSGNVSLSCSTANEAGYPGIYIGLYRVKISKQENGKEMLPPEYNTETTLGYDVGVNSRRTGIMPRFDLK